MHKNNKRTSLLEIVMSTGAVAVFGWVLVANVGNEISAQQSNFMGGAPRQESAEAVSTLRLLFPAGVRSNWHSHSWGQLLMIERGKGLAQDRGGPLREYGPGQPYWTPAGVEHWHGAAPGEDTLQLTIYEGTVNWLEAVTDEVYLARATPQ
jgi:quercetin dioxygenase-like cupin family protein